MYAKYVYNTSATLDNILDDLVALLTGETTPGNLSAGCDTGNTVIRTAISTSPWTAFDDVSGAEQIIRVQMDDDTGVFKYVGITHNATNAIGISTMEDWNAGTDTPTNEVAANYDKRGCGVEIGTGGTIHVYGAQRAIIFMHEKTDGLIGEFRGDPTYGLTGHFEISRDHPSLAVGSGLPNWVVADFGGLVNGEFDTTASSAVFWEGIDEANVTLNPLTAITYNMGRAMYQAQSSPYVSTIGGCLANATTSDPVNKYGIEPICVGGTTDAFVCDARTYYGDISSRCDIWYMPEGTADVLDIMSYNGKRYIVFKGGTNNALTTGTAVGIKILVPYG